MCTGEPKDIESFYLQIHEIQSWPSQRQNTKSGYIEEVQQKRTNVKEEYSVIADANTVVDPLAMMIKFLNASVADVAVSRLSAEDCFASWAEALGIVLVDQSTEG